MTRPVEYQGIADTVSGTTITSNNATWTDNQFASTPAPGYFLEVASGPKAGLLSLVVSCNDASNTLTVADDLSAKGVANGVSFKLRRNWSIGSLFGPNNEAGLGQGTSTTADLILIWNPSKVGGAGYDQYFYSGGGILGSGWRLVGSSPANANQANALVLLDDGVVVKRLQAADVNIVVTGAVKLGPTGSPVELGPNFIGNVYPSGSLTLGTSNLYTGDNSTGVVPGTSTTADLVLIWNQALGGGAGGYDQYFYSSGGILGAGWRLIGASPANTNQAGAVLAVGKSIIIRRNSGGSFTWFVPQPFPNP
jgi:uncharacterized protein (TIGR02597 family)